MIKVMIVDDELLVRVGVKMSVNWEQHGFELAGEAEDGKQALEMAGKVKPDIVLTDIKMPVMDGIEFLKNLKKLLPNTRAIILSGYNDFEYVREAVKLGAVDYILKLSLKPEELLNILGKVKRDIERDHKKIEENTSIKSLLNANIDEIKERYFYRLLMGSTFDIKDFKSQIGESLKIFDKPVIIMDIKVDHKSRIKNKARFTDIDLFDFSLKNIANEVVESYFPCETLRVRSMELAALITMDSVAEESLIKVCRGINDALQMYFSTTVYFGISNVHYLPADYKEAWHEAGMAANQKYLHAQETVFFYKDLPPYNVENKMIYAGKIEKELYGNLELMNTDMAINVLNRLYDELESSNVSPAKAKAELKEVLFTYSQVLKAFGISSGKLSQQGTGDLFEEFDEIDDITAIKEWFANLTVKLFENIKSNHSGMYREEIDKIRRFVSEHYMDDLSLSAVAAYVNMNESYLSNLFSKETGTSFIEYLTNIRIEKAKEYLRESDLKVYEISEKIGYCNEHYFSKVFKKVVGITPLEYKKLSR